MNNSLGRIKSNFTKYSELFYTSTKHTVSFHTKILAFTFSKNFVLSFKTFLTRKHFCFNLKFFFFEFF